MNEYWNVAEELSRYFNTRGKKCIVIHLPNGFVIKFINED